MDDQERRVREEIATRMIQETIMSLSKIARWIGLSEPDVQALAQQIGRGSTIIWTSAT